MVIQASTEAGDRVEVRFHPLLTWVMGICASLITMAVSWGVYNIDKNRDRIGAVEARVNGVEMSRLTTADAQNFVTIREYDASISSINAQLARIEDKIDQLRRMP